MFLSKKLGRQWLWSTIVLFGFGTPALAATDTLLYQLPDQANYSGVLARLGGRLFGVTSEGGARKYNDGQVYSLRPPAAGETNWRFQVIYKFHGVDGRGPTGQLIRDKSGALYGTTVEGGEAGDGTVFKLTPPSQPGQHWVLTTLYSFQNNGDGEWPWGGVVADEGGALYGTTKFGGGGDCSNLCGVVFRLTPPASGAGAWTETVLYRFSGADGTWPNSGLLIDKSGVLYGTTVNGGIWGQGTVFSLTPRILLGTQIWEFARLHDFEGNVNGNGAYDGAQPNGGLIGGAGDLWGTSQGGGSSTACGGSGCGTVFQLVQQIAGNPTYTIKIWHGFGGVTVDGGLPEAGLFQAKKSRVIWGTTSEGGVRTHGTHPCDQGCGTVFEVTPDRLLANVWHFATAWKFEGIDFGDAEYPASPLEKDKTGALYGTGFGGTVYKFAP